MSGTAFRKKIQAILQTTPESGAASREIVQALRDGGVSLKNSWAKPLLESGVQGIRERSLGDTRLEALEVCSFLIVDLGVDLVGPGLVSGDRRVLDRLPLPPVLPQRRPSLGM